MNTDPHQARELRIRFAANLREQRQILGLSQEALADLAGLHRTYVSQVERTVTNVSLDNVHKLALALEIDAHVLFLPMAQGMVGKAGELKQAAAKVAKSAAVAKKTGGGR
jgi:transcriptional regulator with XRE-family HTH domain